MQELKGRCKTCYWNVNLPRCKPEKMINLSGNCPKWRLRKMTDSEKAKDAAIMKAAHAKDVARKAEEKSKRKNKHGRGA